MLKIKNVLNLLKNKQSFEKKKKLDCFHFYIFKQTNAVGKNVYLLAK